MGELFSALEKPLVNCVPYFPCKETFLSNMSSILGHLHIVSVHGADNQEVFCKTHQQGTKDAIYLIDLGLKSLKEQFRIR